MSKDEMVDCVGVFLIGLRARCCLSASPFHLHIVGKSKQLISLACARRLSESLKKLLKTAKKEGIYVEMDDRVSSTQGRTRKRIQSGQGDGRDDRAWGQIRAAADESTERIEKAREKHTPDTGKHRSGIAPAAAGPGPARHSPCD
jgi:hypothetical protein